MAFEEYPPNRSWEPGQAEAPWCPPVNRRGEPVAWYQTQHAGERHPGRPGKWSEGDQREGLIGSVLDLQKWRKFAGKPLDRATLERYSNAKLEHIFGQMLLAAAEGRAPQRPNHSAD